MLRDYQRDLYVKTVEALKSGFRRPLVAAPCGSGKSYLFAEMVRRTRGEALVLTHRQELLEQHRALFRELGIENVRVGMVRTEANRLGSYATPTIIITDEAHLSRSNSWVKVLDYYDTYTVGFTATPVRLDGRPLGDIYDALIQGVDVRWLIEHERLAPFEYYAPTAVETAGLVPGRMGDFEVLTLDRLMCSGAVYSDVLSSWGRLADRQKTIAYCVSVRHALETAALFQGAGIPAAMVHGGTPTKQRAAILNDFRSGKITVLCNVGIISEGVSIDDVGCCLLLRPTESLALYWQQAMRCMRYLPGKTAKIIDCVGNYTRNPMPDTPIIWNLSQKIYKKSCMDPCGNFYVRVCKNCYKTFPAADICPYCGEPYPLHPRELKARQEIELARISAEEAEKVAAQKADMRREVQKARTYPELARIAAERGYSRGWIYQMMKARGKNGT